jgi:hypothetical protein
MKFRASNPLQILRVTKLHEVKLKCDLFVGIRVNERS